MMHPQGDNKTSLSRVIRPHTCNAVTRLIVAVHYAHKVQCTCKHNGTWNLPGLWETCFARVYAFSGDWRVWEGEES